MSEHVVYDYCRIADQEVVIADVNSLPVSFSSAPFVAQDCIIALCHRGSAYFDCELLPMEFKEHDISIALPNHIINRANYSDDYLATLIIISRSFFDELVNHESFKGYLKYKEHPNVHLNSEQYAKINAFIAVLRIICDSEHPKRHETLGNLLDIIFYALTRWRGEEKQEPVASRSMHQFNTFYQLLQENYHTEHMIDWYANKMCLTPKYLSSLIRNATGKSAAKWIDEVLVLHAKRLLCTRRDLTVQQIAFSLGFKENATFCRFFKDQTGLRPSEYREKQ